MKKLYLLIGFFLTINTLFAQDEMFKSLFIYNFTKNIEWPDSYKSGSFVIAVLGNSAIIAELEKIAKLKKVGDQSISIKEVKEVSEISKCHMLYITPAKSSQLSSALAKVASEPVVVITDKEGLAKEGAGLNFVKVDGKQKFEINQSALGKNGLKVNSFLASLGIVIN